MLLKVFIACCAQFPNKKKVVMRIPEYTYQNKKVYMLWVCIQVEEEACVPRAWHGLPLSAAFRIIANHTVLVRGRRHKERERVQEDEAPYAVGE